LVAQCSSRRLAIRECRTLQPHVGPTLPAHYPSPLRGHPAGSLLLDQSLETAHQLGITQAAEPSRKARLPKRIAEPGEWTPLVFKGLPNSNADESQSLESIDPMNLIVDWMAESADLERTHPVPTIADACWHPIETVTRRLVSRFTRMRRAIIFPRATFRFITFSGQLRPRSNDWPLSGPQPRTRGEDEPVAGRAAPTACWATSRVLACHS